MKEVVFYGASLEALRAFPERVRRECGYQIDRVQRGFEPSNWKPMPAIGAGVREIRVRSQGQFRIIYLASLEDGVAVLHAFQKKTRRTSQVDILRAKAALKHALKRSD